MMYERDNTIRHGVNGWELIEFDCDYMSPYDTRDLRRPIFREVVKHPVYLRVAVPCERRIFTYEHPEHGIRRRVEYIDLPTGETRYQNVAR